MAAMAAAGSWAQEETRTLIYSNDFEEASDFTLTGKTGNGWALNPGSTTRNTFGSKVIGVGKASDGDQGAMSPALGVPAEATLVDVEFDFKMDAVVSGKGSGIHVVTGQNTSGWLNQAKSIFSISASANANMSWGSVTANGTDIKSSFYTTEAGALEDLHSGSRGTTGLVHLSLRINLTNKILSYKMTSGEKTLEQENVAFANPEATTVDGIFIHAGKSYGGTFIDNIKVYTVVSTQKTNVVNVTFQTEDGVTIPEETLPENTQITYVVNTGSEFTPIYPASFTKDDIVYTYVSGGDKVTVSEDKNIILVYKKSELPKFTYNVNLVDAENKIIKTILTDEATYAGKTLTYSYPKYLTDENGKVTYICDKNLFSSSVTPTEAGATNIMYSAYNDIAYFVEAEQGISKYNGWVDNAQLSGNRAVRAFNNESSIMEVKENGVYTITFVAFNNNVNKSTSITLLKNSEELSTSDLTWSYNGAQSSGTISVNDITLIKGDFLKFTTSSTNSVLDYIIINKTGDATITKTIPASGYASFSATSNAVVPEGVTVFKANMNGDNTAVLLSPVETSIIPANTGVILKAEAGDYTFTLTNDAADAIADNALIATTVQPVVPADGTYAALSANAAEFGKLTGGMTLSAGKAYLAVPETAGAKLAVVFDNTTGVNVVEAEGAEAQNAAAFNLAGQRVSGNAKGIVIINGKKYIK